MQTSTVWGIISDTQIIYHELEGNGVRQFGLSGIKTHSYAYETKKDGRSKIS